MVHVTDTAPKSYEQGPGLLSRIGEGILGFLSRIAENNTRVRAVRHLQAMSDEQLARHGLRRDQIVHHVYRDVYYM